MARLYANENFPLSAVEALRRFGHDVLTTADSGRAGHAIPDAEVLAFAIAELRSVVTFNRRHFIQLHHTTPKHAGIVVCTFDPDFAASALRIHTALEARPQRAGQLVRIHRSGEYCLDSVRRTNRGTGRQFRCAPLPPVCFVVRRRIIREVRALKRYEF